MINLRDKGAEIWEGWNKPTRVLFACVAIFVPCFFHMLATSR